MRLPAAIRGNITDVPDKAKKNSSSLLHLTDRRCYGGESVQSFNGALIWLTAVTLTHDNGLLNIQTFRLVLFSLQKGS